MKHHHHLFSLFLSLLLWTTTAMANGDSFDGDWQGQIELPGEGTMEVRIVIADNSFTQYFRGSGANGWSAVEPALSYFEKERDILLVGWINTAAQAIWTENQMFSLSIIDSTKLQVVWTRHVVNRPAAEPGEAWNLRGEGVLTRQ